MANKTNQRRDEMLESIATAPITTPGQLVEKFHVSSETIRKDLTYLARKGLVHKVHGGVVPAERRNIEKSHEMRSVENIETKQRIGTAAARLVQPGDAIVIENGTTMVEFALALRQRVDVLPNTMVITMSFRIADILKDCEGLKLFFLGGWLRNGDLLAYGHHTCRALADFNPDKAFISSASMNEDLYVSDYFDEEIIIRQQILRVAKEKILLLDSSKLYQTSLMNVCHLREIQHLVTDSNASRTTRRKIKETGVELTVV